MKLEVRSKERRPGEVYISGSKNASLPIICAGLLCDEDVILENVPDITDVRTMILILNKIGVKTSFKNNTLEIKKAKKISTNISDSLVGKMRGTYYLMGALLPQKKKLIIASSGGCNLGNRPIDYHLNGFKKMGAYIDVRKDKIFLRRKKLNSALIDLPFPSVGATLNIMLAACKTVGCTIINNCAKEPEVVDVANFINSMGGDIRGAGTKQIIINGVEKFHKTIYRIMEDRIEAGTYLILGAIREGVTLHNIDSKYVRSLITILKTCGYKIKAKNKSITLQKGNDIKPFDVITSPYPGFPTDLGQPLSVLGLTINGESKIKETIFNNRIAHIKELRKMNGDINLIGEEIVINKSDNLIPETVYAHDLRAGAALILASSLCEGTTVIENIDVFLRGYENPIEKLSSFGIECHLVE